MKKFRAFVEGIMRYDIDYTDGVFNCYAPGYLGGCDDPQHCSQTAWLNDSNVMQYTGLKDKGGKEIWEGDVVRCTTNFSTKTQALKTEVTYEQGMFGVKWKEHSGNEMLKLSAFETEVIGNIYENPELVEKE